jgi:N-acetylglucosaminyldiphosphoundecaprenol N-acetyl-beta-D-mannosaminyltransferase
MSESTPGLHGSLIERANILGVGVSAINMGDALRTIEDWIGKREEHYVCITGVHGIMESQRDERLRQIHNAAGLVTPDGMPLVWLSRFQGFRRVSRVYGPDLMLACCAASHRGGYRHFLYGGGPGVVERLAEKLRGRFEGLRIVGSYSPPFRALTPSEDEAVVRHINDATPDIVWVGLSTPTQERWMGEHLGRVHAPVMVGVGAAFDFNAGLKRQAPSWMQAGGLEWLFRLSSEPRRLWRRYLRNNPRFVWYALRQILGIDHYELCTQFGRD